ncbi:hypothetical protein KBI5_11235 [Frankia sp. KB5]|nr:hypothetical protein KBI5_11235 [Frankia sp. KB5]
MRPKVQGRTPARVPSDKEAGGDQAEARRGQSDHPRYPLPDLDRAFTVLIDRPAGSAKALIEICREEA